MLGKNDPLRLLVCVAGIYTFYLVYGIEQEKIAKKGYRNTLFILFIQCLANACFAYIGYLYNSKSHSSKSLKDNSETSPLLKKMGFKHNGHVWLAFVSASYLIAMLSSNHALHYVSYTTAVLGKSIKMIPVMLANVLLAGKKYSTAEIIAVLLITLGIVVFTYDKASGNKSHGKVSAEKDITDALITPEAQGVFLLLLSLTLDGVTGSNQKLFDDEYKPSTHGLMLYMNLWSCLFLIVALAITGEGVAGFTQLMNWPDIQLDVLIFAISSALGQNFIFYTITGPGPLACTTITTTRKFFTILASVLLWPENKLSEMQWGGVAFVFAGLFVELYNSWTRRKSHSHKE